MKKPTILVTNDDGITAPGIRALVEVASQFGNVIVIAPNSPQSGQGHALSLDKPLYLNKVNIFDPSVEAYECSGTPVDCVKLAKSVILSGQAPDLCVSGINHGSNNAINILYSGTMSAAMEAAIEGINSIGFSSLDYSHEGDLSAAKHYAAILIDLVLKNGLEGAKLLNVNIPKLPLDQIKGIKVCHQAKSKWKEQYVKETDHHGQPCYWLTGEFVNLDLNPNCDYEQLQNGFVSVVPSMFDLTDYMVLDKLNQHIKNL